MPGVPLCAHELSRSECRSRSVRQACVALCQSADSTTWISSKVPPRPNAVKELRNPYSFFADIPRSDRARKRRRAGRSIRDARVFRFSVWRLTVGPCSVERS